MAVCMIPVLPAACHIKLPFEQCDFASHCLSLAFLLPPDAFLGVFGGFLVLRRCKLSYLCTVVTLSIHSFVFGCTVGFIIGLCNLMNCYLLTILLFNLPWQFRQSCSLCDILSKHLVLHRQNLKQ